MSRTVNAALVVFALGFAAAPMLGQERAPRAGAPIVTNAVIETAPEIRRPRSGAAVAAVAPDSTEYALGGAGVIADDAVASDELGLCGRKYCGSSYAR